MNNPIIQISFLKAGINKTENNLFAQIFANSTRMYIHLNESRIFQLNRKTTSFEQSRPTTSIFPYIRSTTTKSNSMNNQNRNRSRCEEVRRRVSWGLVDYANWDGDPELKELVRPMFKKKRFVIWSLDLHPGPLDDIRSIIEPLGVEFIEKVIHEPNRCDRMCVCDLSKNLPKLTLNEIHHPNSEVFNRVYNHPKTSLAIARSDALLVTCPIPFVELFMRYNCSIIVVAAIRYYFGYRFQPTRWAALDKLMRKLMSNPRNVISANSYYDLEIMHYYIGARPDYIPGFAVYTGEHYEPIHSSFLYAKRPYGGFFTFWDQQFNHHYRLINATFRIDHFHVLYKSGHEFSDVSKHLGIVHQPYQVLICMLFNQLITVL